MKRTLLIIATTLILSMALFGSVSAQEINDNLVDIVAKTNSLSTLHTIIVETEQADTLASADNTFTLFAPTNGGFGKLPEGLLDALLADPQGALTELLNYHVVPGQLDLTEIIAAGTLTTVSGETLTVEVRKDNVYVNDSRIVTADIPAKNGMIHTLNEVLLPPGVAALPIISEVAAPEAATPPTTPEVTQAEVVAAADETAAAAPTTPTMTIAEAAAANGNFDLLLSAAEMAGLDDELAGPGNYTLFAPTDAAFAALPEDFLNLILEDVEGQLKPLLLYHLVNDRLSINQVANSTLIPTVDGRPLFITTGAGSSPVYANGVQIITSDIQASNGVIHVINAVLVP